MINTVSRGTAQGDSPLQRMEEERLWSVRQVFVPEVEKAKASFAMLYRQLCVTDMPIASCTIFLS